MKKRGFTLVELLAVIVILAIILAIAIPSITSLISNATSNSFNSDAKLVTKGVNDALLLNDGLDLSTINFDTNSTTSKTTFMTDTGISTDNYSVINVAKVKGQTKVKIIGKNKWDGLVVYGTSNNMKVIKYSDTNSDGVDELSDVFADTTGASEPELASNMIPVMYYNGAWVKSDADNLIGTYAWYNYANKQWANAVTVTSSKLNTYQSAAVGTVVNESDILTYLVWIPRYSYYITTSGTTTPSTIQVKFEGNTQAKSAGNAISTYLTHPAFTFGVKQLNGFWVGKFEVENITACTAKNNTPGAYCDLTTLGIQIKPNIISWRGARIATFYTAIKNMTASGNTFGFNSNEVDTHMMLNSEWGAVAYLSMSTYGLGSEIYKNNSRSMYTGRSGGNVGGSQVKSGSNEYIDTGYYTYDGKCATTTTLVPGIDSNCTTVGNTVSNTALSYKASTTGTIYGVYDMSGGAGEYVMGDYKNYSGYAMSRNSGFNGLTGSDSGTYSTGLAFPDSKYYNSYTTNNASTTCNGGICYGQALSETSGWYSDAGYIINNLGTWLGRGNYYDGAAGAGAFWYDPNDGDTNTFYSARVVITMSN